MQNSFSPTPYSEVNIVLHHFLEDIQSILGDQFYGLYLYGSLALGDFNPRTSDIDFVVLTRQEIPENRFVALQDMHALFDRSDSPWSMRIEAAYIPLEALNCPPSAAHEYPQIEKGTQLVRSPLEPGWAYQRLTLREHETLVAGPSLRGLIDPVDPMEMNQAAMSILTLWQEQSQRDPSWLAWARQRSSQAFIVLTLCRIRYSRVTGSVASKPASARWAQAVYGERWRPLIEGALNGPHDDQEIAEVVLAETLALLNDTLLLLQTGTWQVSPLP